MQKYIGYLSTKRRENFDGIDENKVNVVDRAEAITLIFKHTLQIDSTKLSSNIHLILNKWRVRMVL